MRDIAIEIVREIWKDLTDRRGFSMDDVDDVVKEGMILKWYIIAARAINPGSDPIIPGDIFTRVRGW
jgi:hypothetical protein